MKSLTQQLTNYARYHRDKRNVATHFVGIPLIVFAIMVLLNKPAFTLLGVQLTPTVLILVGCCLYYLRLSLSLGIIMSLLLSMLLVLAMITSKQSNLVWLSVGVASFFIGWLFQLLGHYYEGKKPAFVDDLIGLLIGPLFVVVEVLFMFGMYKQIQQQINHTLEGETQSETH